jgi:hypothetical protein
MTQYIPIIVVIILSIRLESNIQNGVPGYKQVFTANDPPCEILKIREGVLLCIQPNSN